MRASQRTKKPNRNPDFLYDGDEENRNENNSQTTTQSSITDSQLLLAVEDKMAELDRSNSPGFNSIEIIHDTDACSQPQYPDIPQIIIHPCSPVTGNDSIIIVDSAAESTETVNTPVSRGCLELGLGRLEPRSLTSLLAETPTPISTSTQIDSKTDSCDEVGIRTLISESAIPPPMPTPTQRQLRKIQEQLLVVNNDLLSRDKTIIDLKNEITALQVQLALKEEELENKNEFNVDKKIRNENISLRKKFEEQQKKIKIIDQEKAELEKQVKLEKKAKTTENTRLIREIDECKKKIKIQDEQLIQIDITKTKAEEAVWEPNIQTKNKYQKLAETEDDEIIVLSDSPGQIESNTAAHSESVKNDDVEEEQKVWYFRSWRDKLSNFYADPIKYNGKQFKTPEHCYQYQKAVHHRNYQAAEEIQRAKTAGHAKIIANRQIPNCNQEWHETKFEIMENITRARLLQCPSFRAALEKTGNDILIHNMEDDDVWGFGRRGDGQNMNGKILMKVRDSIISESAMKIPQEVVQQEISPKRPLYSDVTSGRHMQQKETSKNVPKIAIVGNSNTKIIGERLEEKRAAITNTQTFSGAPSWYIRDQMRHVMPSSPPSHVVLHSGDIDARNFNIHIEDAVADMMSLISEAEMLYPDTRILVNTLSSYLPNYELDRRPLRMKEELMYRINRMNSEIRFRCSTNPFLSVIECSKLHLYDSIHFTNRSKDFVADKIIDSVNFV